MVSVAIITFSVSIGISFALGLVLITFFRRISQSQKLMRARGEAERLLIEAKEEAEHLTEEAKLAAVETEDELWSRHEKELADLDAKVKQLDEEYRKNRSTADRSYNQDAREVQKQLQAVQEREKRMADRQERFAQQARGNEKQRAGLIAELKTVANIDPEVLKLELAVQIENQNRIEARKKAQAFEDEVRQHSEEIAKRFIGNALNRFARTACTERGIGIVEIPNEDVKRRMLGPEGANIRALEEHCGVEIALSEANTFQVASFDPIKREVSTRCLEKLLHERAPNLETVKRLFEKTTRDVSRKVEADGNRVAAELGQRDLHPEIKKMLGTLRYRYSFAQNQHFHVAEVGWLCGLLAAELGRGIDVLSAKRVGLLHDVGKAMDHAIEGGHAVIGADFITQHGEKPHIVHAVRAHHYEEQPNSELAFLVIAADAMSGARPGARRSTVSLYNQKIEALTTIAEGFRGVTKTLILNAGREVRVLVDGRKVNDEQSLRLCRDIADKIEDECQYPGQIKVVIIRETHAEAQAR
jgi:ribonuclease Y